jgi:hypothetical protein
MKLKTLLLSSAAAFAVVGGAQAADLSVAEPVDYVKVCDAFGAGYWYIPGTDTCLKIGGLIQFDVNFHSTKNEYAGSTPHSASWDMNGEYHLNATAKSMTEYGPLTGWIELRGLSNHADVSNYYGGRREAYVDSAYLELGMLKAGAFESNYHYFGSYNFSWDTYDAADDTVNQVALTWAASGFGIQLAVEDPRDRWGTSLSSSYSSPDVVGDITWANGPWDAKLAAGFAETTAGSGFGAQIGAQVKLDQLAPGDMLGAVFAWSQSETPNFGAETMPIAKGGSVWSAVVAFKHFWAPTLSSAVTFQYADESGSTGAANNYSGYTIAGNIVWAPVTNFSAGLEVGYSKSNQPGTTGGVTNSDGVWGVKVRLVRQW